jgi:quinol monooxygenase YgiN
VSKDTIRIVATWNVKPGHEEKFRRNTAKAVEDFQVNQPWIESMDVYFSADGSTCTWIEAHPNSSKLLEHATSAAAQKYRALLMEDGHLTGAAVFGNPSNQVIEAFRAFNASISRRYAGFQHDSKVSAQPSR